jgi:hypothetical protein
LDSIPDGLEMHTIVGLDDLSEYSQVVRDGSRHCYSVSLPALGAPLDVGEEEGNGAGGEVGHARS